MDKKRFSKKREEGGGVVNLGTSEGGRMAKKVGNHCSSELHAVSRLSSASHCFRVVTLSGSYLLY